MNVLFHIDESSKWEMVLGNIQNMIQYLDQEAIHYRIELVANGPAVCELQDTVSEEMGFKKTLHSLSPKSSDLYLPQCTARKSYLS